MKRSRLLVSLVLILCATALFASDSYQQELSAALVNRILIVRNYYNDARLSFGSDGKLASNSGFGFGPGEGRIYIKNVQLEPGKLTLTGVRPLDVFNSGEREWQIAPTATAVSIEILLPAQEDPKTAVPRLISAVFLKKSEVATLGCSAEEQQRFLQDTVDRMNHPKKGKTEALPDVATLDELHPDCLPNGDKAYRVGRGIKPPHPKYTPDPKYVDAARNARLQGTTVLLAIVTPEGTATSIAVRRSLGEGLSDKMRPLGYQLDQRAVEAVAQWKFDPATFEGIPVPVAINVEVNFKLY